jgi:hypothetical protein
VKNSEQNSFHVKKDDTIKEILLRISVSDLFLESARISRCNQ